MKEKHDFRIGAWYLRVRRLAGAPVVGMRVLLPGGARIEDPPGLALVTGRLLGEGTRQRDWRQLSEEAERGGFSLAAFGDWEHHGLAADSIAASWPLALERVGECLLEPRFDPDRADWVRQQARAERRSLADQPEIVTGWAFLQQLYRPHPLSRPLHGPEEDGLLGIELESCEAFHHRALERGGIVTMAGDLEVEEAAERWRQQFGARVVDAATEPRPPAAVGGEARQVVQLSQGDQAHLMLGRLTLLRADPDYVPMQLLSVILGAGAGLTGRIPERVREAEGLAYSVHVGTTEGAGLDPGHLSVYVGTSPETVSQAEACVRQELERLVESGPRDEEVEEARDYLLGRQPFRRETARQVADLLAVAALYDEPSDDPAWVEQKIRAVTRDDLARLSRTWLDPSHLKTTVGLPKPPATA